MGVQVMEWRPNVNHLRHALTGAVILLVFGLLPCIASAQENDKDLAILEALQNANRKIASRIIPSIVNVSSERSSRTSDILPFDHPLFGEIMPEQYQTRSLGSGVIIDASNGYLLTNYHVVEAAEKILITFRQNEQDKTIPGDVVGSDNQSELAVVRVDLKALAGLPLKAADFGNSDDVQVGDIVYAVGNPFGYSQTFNMGIVTGISRWWADRPRIGFIQTDASVNPGNSGGALVDIHGRVIGINTFIASTSGGSEGIGFAIPINDAQAVIPELVTKGYVTYGFLGVEPQSLEEVEANDAARKRLIPEDGQGAWVKNVSPDSPAEQAGIRPRDTIIRIGERKIKTPHDLYLAIKGLPVGQETEVVIWRPDEGEKAFSVEIAPLKAPVTVSGSRAEGLLGLGLKEVPPGEGRGYGLGSEGGIVVTRVDAGSVAEKEGIHVGDILAEIDHHNVTTLDEFRSTFVKSREQRNKENKPLDEVLLSIRRGEMDLFKALKVE